MNHIFYDRRLIPSHKRKQLTKKELPDVKQSSVQIKKLT
jgi:hypothetical protein